MIYGDHNKHMIEKFVSVAEMISIEKAADAAGHTYDQMMANAGWALAQAVMEAYDHLPKKTVLGLVGKGNNGGDTLVALGHLSENGWTAKAYVIGDRSEDPLMVRYIQLGGEFVSHSFDKGDKKLRALVINSAVILDGLLGTGIRLPLRDPFPKVLQVVNETLGSLSTPPKIVAVDCPSGVDCDSGDAASDTMKADFTVCMAAVKKGLLAFPAYKYLGELKVVGIGLSEELAPWKEIKRFVVNQEYVYDKVPERPLDAHKGTFGNAMIVAGSLNYTGTVLLAGKAAFRSGTGWVTLAVPSPLHGAIAGNFPEATWVHLSHENGYISTESVQIVYHNLSRVTAMLIGPGFGLQDTTRDFIDGLLAGNQSSSKIKVGILSSSNRQGNSHIGSFPSLVVDADGLKLLSQLDDWPHRLPPLTILTPHPGEMAIMTGIKPGEIQENRIEIAETFSKKWGHVVVLKGAFTIITEPEGRTAIVPIASPALSRAGTGDVLAGLIVGLKAQGIDAFNAAVCGTWIHARAGLNAAKRLGSTAGVLAGDLIDEIPGLMPR
ncbi:MAG: NAD(P)H-hydrate dehydratase [Anaerolineales bacterium]|jgi:NAD(P)H-hydrate epimerase